MIPKRIEFRVLLQERKCVCVHILTLTIKHKIYSFGMSNRQVLKTSKCHLTKTQQTLMRKGLVEHYKSNYS